MAVAPTLKLNNGMEIPAIGLGTFMAKDLYTVTKISIRFGYRLFDTAFFYRNQKQIGEAIKDKIEDGTVKREDLFIVDKLWNTQHRPEKVQPTLKRCLLDLQLDYVDAFLMHSPMAYQPFLKEKGKLSKNSVTLSRETYSFSISDQPIDLSEIIRGWILPGMLHNDNEYAEIGVEEAVSIEDTWQAMENCVHQGYAKSIGVSNFNKSQLEQILKIAKVKPVINQIECHPYLIQKDLIEFCKKRKIIIMAYSPLYAPQRNRLDSSIFTDPVILEMAKRYGKSCSQIVLRYLTQLGIVPIPKSEKSIRLKQNIDIFDFNLSIMDLRTIEKLNKKKRSVAFKQCARFREYPF